MADLLVAQDSGEFDLEVLNGVAALDESPFEAVVLSLWGGNLDDNGTEATRSKMYWANFAEPDENAHLRSRTQALLLGLPAISANISRIEEAAKADLEWMQAVGVASAIEISASMPHRNTVKLAISITGADGTQWPFEFARPWGQQVSS